MHVNLSNVLVRVAARRPDAVAVRFGGDELTFEQFVAVSRQFSAFLDSVGVVPGDRVGVYASNRLESFCFLLGIWMAGAIAVPYNLSVPRGPLRHAVEDSDPTLIVVADSEVELIQDVCDGLGGAERILAVGPNAATAGATWTWHDVTTLPERDEIVPRLDGDEALLMYTSGSTGIPKGVRQTHRTTGAAVDATIDIFDLNADDSALVCTPLFHVGGLQLISLPVLVAGGSVTLMSKWDPIGWVDLARSWSPSYVALVPTMAIDVANRMSGAEPVQLPSVRICAVGGSGLPEGPLRRFREATGIGSVINIYGQTEQNGLAACERIGENPLPVCLGRPLEQVVQWQLVDPTTQQRVAESSAEIGELQVRGDAVTPGYWKRPDADAERFTDGWFRTGDLMRIRPDGQLEYVERIDDMIISGGENVYPQMVENYLASSPDVAEVAVIGTPHERWVEQVTAIVVASREGVTVADIAEFCQHHPDLRGLSRPRRIEMVPALPRTGNNKINKPELKRMFR
ncbi:class I adenylate-forming enzyme family protein [Rhodococcus sp. LB1]|uniref:class I adenylate-forming enzyme family protein n=1 Tax=Rhodococcus sp. LB1 TaxID=1807499 RepID=UPI001E2E3A1A|nr:class I adenylate-forming enzyme family protein [Rhodococcus sp. LB1]